MKIYMAKEENSSVFLLVSASDWKHAKEKLEGWKPGVYTYTGESVEFQAGESKLLAMVEIDFMIRLPQNLGLQTSLL